MKNIIIAFLLTLIIFGSALGIFYCGVIYQKKFDAVSIVEPLTLPKK